MSDLHGKRGNVQGVVGEDVGDDGQEALRGDAAEPAGGVQGGVCIIVFG